ARFSEKGLECRIDHRSYERQGVEQFPTVHEGPAIRQMEARGIRTDKGDFNRWVKATNALIGKLKKKLQRCLTG
ncbi:plasmid mobilization system relaxase, partial [gut metagenome]